MTGVLFKKLPTEDKPEMVSQVITEMQKIHQIPTHQEYGKVKNILIGKKSSWPEFIKNTINETLTHPSWSKIFIELPQYSQVITQLQQTISEKTPRIPQNPQYTLLHCDMNHNNIFVKDNTLEGIIDWSVACIGDPLYDLARFKMFIYARLDQKARDTFNQTLNLNQKDSEILDIYYLIWLQEYILWYFIDGETELIERQIVLINEYFENK